MFNHFRRRDDVEGAIGIRKLFVIQIGNVHLLPRQLHELAGVIAGGRFGLEPLPKQFDEPSGARAHVKMAAQRFGGGIGGSHSQDGLINAFGGHDARHDAQGRYRRKTVKITRREKNRQLAARIAKIPNIKSYG
jgi:hypothetical protein